MKKEKEQRLSHPFTFHKHITHDLPLFRSLVLSWIVVLVTGFALHFFKEHSFIPSFSSSYPPGKSNSSWKHLERHGDVELLRRPIVLKKDSPFSVTPGLYAHRALATVDIPIETLLHVFRDTPHNVWAKDLKETQEFHKSGAHHKKGNKQFSTSIVRQLYSFPMLPGVADREYVMEKKMKALENEDGSHASVTYEFTSISNTSDFDIPCLNCVRATNFGSKWKFTALDKAKTKVAVDVAVDPKAPNLTTFFVNNIVLKDWPHATLHNLLKEARHHLHRDDEIQITNIFTRLFPLWV